MTTLAEVRAKYPEYNDMSDTELARALHGKFYSDLDFGDFAKRVGLATSKESLRATNPAEYDPASPEYRAKYGAQSDSGWQNFAAGMGKGMTDLVRGVGQMVGAVNREDIAASRQQDADLMSTRAGRGGQIAGMTAAMLPAAFLPGANTLAGSAAIGAATGLAMPSESTRETLTNTALGGVTAPLGLLAGRGIAAAGRGAASLVEPFTKGGQRRIASRTLQAFAGDDAAVQQAIQNIDNAGASLPGYKPSTAELAQNAGISQLDRSLRNNPELGQTFSAADQANRGVIREAVEGIARTPAEREAAIAARDAATDALYRQADNTVVRADADFGKLMMRPSMNKAWAEAEKLAAEQGEQITRGPEITGKALHYVKKALDDLVETAEAGNQKRAVTGTRSAFLEWVDANVPPYAQARQQFQQLSQPINQMDVGQALRDRLLPPMADFGADRMTPNAYAAAVRAADATAAKATGFSGAKMDKVLTPEQMGTVRKVGETLARRSNAEDLGRARGSNTAQNLVSQNVLRQTLGPFGLPQTVMESTLMQSLMRPAQFAGKLGEQRVMGLLSEAALDPALARELLARNPQLAQLLWQRQGLLSPMLLPSVYATQQ